MNKKLTVKSKKVVTRQCEQFKFKITSEWLLEKSACSEGKAWFDKQNQTDALKVLAKLRKQNWSWFGWLAPRLMTRRQQIRWAIFCSEQVIGIFEKAYPKDDRPRKAIQAAKDFLDGKITACAASAAAYAAGNAAYAANAAGNAAYAADATTYAAYAAYAATYAANAASAAASAAADAAADAASAANAAGNAAADAAANAEKMRNICADEAVRLLNEGEKI